MKRVASIPTPGVRSAFSLFELMLVLAILITVTSIAVPPMMDRLKNGKVQEAADLVRETLANARRYAIEAGVDYHFRYEVNGQFFVAIPAEPNPGLANNYSEDTEDIRVALESGELDEELMIAAMDGDESGAENLEAEAFNQLSNAGELAGKTWSKPIVFRFDGTAEDRTFRIMTTDRRTSEISVRGLTGAVRATQVFVMEESQ
ncbi:MAG: hypothetical protein JNM43_10050 [Planctomycetaceae bacterium]|nr:hypothetical protein [Planctomycetaceae bacterium]